MNYPKIRNVKVLEDFFIEVSFENKITKVYDCKPLFSETIFEKLKDIAFFRLAESNSGPYAVIWDDEVDLAESEIWLNGKEKEERHVV